MMYAQIRFEVDSKGQYAEFGVQLEDVSDCTHGAIRAEALCEGYFLGSGRKAHVQLISNYRMLSTNYRRPEALRGELERFLK